MVERPEERTIRWHAGKVGYEESCRLLGQRGLVLWFTGLSGSGKSTLAVEVERHLHEAGRAVYLLDGDNIRHGLNADLGFSEADRNENIRRIAEVAALFQNAGLITLVSFIAPYRKMRAFARSRVEAGSFIEVYVKADLETCMRRDPKALYARAKRGEILAFTGVSDPYEEPEAPELTVETDRLSLEESTAKVLDFLRPYVEEAV